jgi:N-acetylglucosaminyldiphosphoundecaprenol N-acetyl-beta-D-mannosaminyltransferase
MTTAVDTAAESSSPAVAERPFERRTVMQAAVDIAQPEAILEYLTSCLRERRGCCVVGISAPYASAMAHDPALREEFLKADLLIPDGKGFTWGARLLDVPCGERLAIPDLCELLLARCNELGLKVFVYGATEELNKLACENVRVRFPALTVAGQHGYNQGPAEEDALIARLRDEKFHLLIVARPSPDKERFLNRCCREAGVVGIAAGGYADILAGKTTRAPAVVQALGMEWLYRVIQEPRRLWKRVALANAQFACAVLWAHLRLPAKRPWWGSVAVQATVVTLLIAFAYLYSLPVGKGSDGRTAYYAPLNAPYHFDDPEYIKHNPTIRSFSALSEITVLAHRKLWWISNAICYRLSELFGVHEEDNPDVRFFRAWNVACHLIAALALLGLLRRCLRSAGYIQPGADGAGSPWDLAAFAAAAIFAAHPLCTESVTYISGRDNGQGGMFYLLGLYAAAIFFERLGSIQNRNATIQNPWPNWVWPLAWTVLFGGCAVLTKESYLTFPGAVILAYLFFYRGSLKRTVSLGLLLGITIALAVLAWAAASRHEGTLGPAFQVMLVATIVGGILGRQLEKGTATLLQKRIHVGWALLVCVAGLAAVALVMFPYAYERTLGALTGYQNSNYVRSLCSQAYAVPQMLLKAVRPFNTSGHTLNIDHDFPSITDPNDPRTIEGAVILGVLAVFGLAGIYRGWLGSFGVLLALLSIAPTNSVIERGDIASERNFYIAAAGGACFLAWIVGIVTGGLFPRFRRPASPADPAPVSLSIISLQERGLWAGALACCIAGPFSALTVLRNQEWYDPQRLWHVAFEQSPQKIRVLYNLGMTNKLHKRWKDAEFDFSNIIKIGEYKAENHLFRNDEAVEVKCFHLAYGALAEVQLQRYMKTADPGDYTQLNDIDKLFRQGLERSAYDPDLAWIYAQFLQNRGQFSQAQPILQKALEMHGWSEQLYFPLGMACLQNGEYQNAVNYLGAASAVVQHHPLGVSMPTPADQRAVVVGFLGLARFMNKDTVQAQLDFEESLRLDPLGVLHVLTATTQAWNPKLPETNDPLRKTRRDLLRMILECLDHTIPGGSAKNKPLLQSTRNLIDAELQRRAAHQAQRLKMGFTDDPDEAL